MSYKLKRSKTIQQNIRRIGRDQIDKAIADIDDASLDRHEAIHQVRKRCKKLRALVRLVRPALGKTYQRENARFRDIARSLSGIRDEQSMVEALKRLQARLGDRERARFDPVLGKLRKKRDAAAASSTQSPEALLAEARRSLGVARRAVDGWRLDADGFQAVQGFGKTYQRGRKAARRAFETGAASDFHQWRKRVKYHTHHLQLLRPLWPRVNKAWRSESKDLADILGNDHDLSLLDALLESEGEELAKPRTRQRLQKAIHREQQRLRWQAWETGQRLYAEKPGALKKRWKRYWQTWQVPAP
ncbi:CHAD domain-containing protein [Marinobacter zhanjiangensis]|uniref:CHAD domain-containing protein n=1 Tax=Marinobacter zhanjiangensis TaxID=578215 RepID=A0ABQ3AVS6_9GAMM|nr:CHAD domain-containing protein [Marinobacter zhanjiangensis]GGY66868.1 CHAD domain-containing protein [Marinobacter zhanjiangensis]